MMFITSCGYQNLYTSQGTQNKIFHKIFLEGSENINYQIINAVKLKEDSTKKNLNDIIIRSSMEINSTSKNSKGKVETFKSILKVDIEIKKENQTIKRKAFIKETNYNNKDNKSELIKQQNFVKNNLINRVIEDVLLFLNT